MPKQKIMKFNDEPGDSEEWYLDYAKNHQWQKMELGYEVIPLPTVTLEEIADFCDRNAEDRNSHDHVGTHRILAAFLHQKLGRSQATALMWEIAEYGGLDAMSGVRGKTDAFADFGIKDCWADWKLKD